MRTVYLPLLFFFFLRFFFNYYHLQMTVASFAAAAARKRVKRIAPGETRAGGMEKPQTRDPWENHYSGVVCGVGVCRKRKKEKTYQFAVL